MGFSIETIRDAVKEVLDCGADNSPLAVRTLREWLGEYPQPTAIDDNQKGNSREGE